MENTRIRLLLTTIAQESATLRLLSYDSERLKKQFGLSEADLDALRSVDLLRASELSGRRSPVLPSALMPGPQANGASTTASMSYASLSEKQGTIAELKAATELYAEIGMLTM